MTDTPKKRYQDPDYVQGQLAGITATLIALANLLPQQDVLDELSIRFQAQRDAMTFHPVSEHRLTGLDDYEKALRLSLG